MLPSQQRTIRLVGSALAKLLGSGTLLPDVLNALLCSDVDPRLSDAEAEAAFLLFAVLCDYRPDAVDLARTR